MLNYIKPLIVLLALIVAGCATPEPQIKEVFITKKEVETRLPPDALLRDCKIATPPNPNIYVKATYKQKEEMLAAYANQQTINLGECNKDKEALRKWKKDNQGK